MTGLACGRATRPLALALAGVLAVTLALAGWPAATARADVCDAPVVTRRLRRRRRGSRRDRRRGRRDDRRRGRPRPAGRSSRSRPRSPGAPGTPARCQDAGGGGDRRRRVGRLLQGAQGAAAAGGGVLAARRDRRRRHGGRGAGRRGGRRPRVQGCCAPGGRLILKTGKRVLRSGGALSKIAKLAAGATGLAAIAVRDRARRRLGAAQPARHRRALRPRARRRAGSRSCAPASTATPPCCSCWWRSPASGLAALRGSVVETRQVLGGLVGAAILIGLVGSLVYALVVWTDAITSGLVHSHWGQRALGDWRDLGDALRRNDAGEGAGHAASSLLSSAEPAGPGERHPAGRRLGRAVDPAAARSPC